MRGSLAALAITALVALAAPGARGAETATLTVTGEGTAAATPDIATVRAGVETEGHDAVEALSANNDLANAVIAEMKAAGVAPKDIQTSGLQVQPRYARPNPATPSEPPQIAGYRVTNTVMLTVRDLAGLGKVLDRLVMAGANRIDSLSFDVANDQALADAARKAAVADARRAAEAIAGAAGVKLVRVLSVSEGGGRPVPMPGVRMALAAKAVPIEAGQTEVHSSVTMVWEIAPAK